MKRLYVTESNTTLSQLVGAILEIYDNGGIREIDVPAKIMAAVIPGNEGLLRGYRMWMNFPSEHRRALAEIVVNIEGLAGNWHRETGINFIPPAVETIEYMTNFLNQGTSLTISQVDGYSPTATIHAAGYRDKTVHFGTMMLALTSMGFSGEMGGQPDDVFPLYLSV